MNDLVFSTASKIRVVTEAPRRGLKGVIACLTPTQMNDFCDLLGTPYAPVSKIAPVFFLRILALCMVSIQEWFLTKSRLLYGMYIFDRFE